MLTQPSRPTYLILMLCAIAPSTILFFPYRTVVYGIQIDAFRVTLIFITLLYVLHLFFCRKIGRLSSAQYILVALSLLSALSILQTNHLYKSIGAFLQLSMHIGFLFIIRDVFIYESRFLSLRRTLRSSFKVYTACVCGSILVSLLLSGGVAGMRGGNNATNPNNVARAAVSALPLLIPLAFLVRGLLMRWFWALAGVWLALAIALTGSRSGLLSLLVLIFGVFVTRKKIFNNASHRYTYVVLLSTIAAVSIPFLQSFRGWQLFNVIGTFIENGSMHAISEAVGATRFALYMSGFELIRENWLFGIGVGTSRFVYIDALGRGMVQHSDLMRLWVGAGVMAAVCYCAFFGVMLKRALKVVRNKCDKVERSYVLALSIGVVTQIVMGIFQMTLWWGYVWYLSGLLLGVNAVYSGIKPIRTAVRYGP